MNGLTYGINIGIPGTRFLGQESFHPTADGYTKWAATFSAEFGSSLGENPNPSPAGSLLGRTIPLPQVDLVGPQPGVAHPAAGSTISVLNGNPNLGYRLVVRSTPYDLGVIRTDASGSASVL